VGYDYTSVIQVATFSIVLSAFWIYIVEGLINSKSKTTSPAIYTVLEIIASAFTVGYIYYLYYCITKSPRITTYCNFSNCAVAIIASLFVAFVIRFGILKNTESVIFSDLVGLVLMPVTFATMDISNKYSEFYTYYGNIVNVKWFCIINLIVLFAVNILVALFFAKSVLDIVNCLYAPAWIYTMAISISVLMLATATIMCQFGVKFSSVIISAVYIAVACLLLFIGFKKSYTVVRSGGLVLILCAFAKLCFIDTSHLDSTWKILAYFAFGAILILISFFYQRFSKKLEKDAVALVDEPEKQ
jgi:hypothetical protein